MGNASGGAGAARPGLKGSWTGSENPYGAWPDKLQRQGNQRVGTVCNEESQRKYQRSRERKRSADDRLGDR